MIGRARSTTSNEVGDGDGDENLNPFHRRLRLRKTVGMFRLLFDQACCDAGGRGITPSRSMALMSTSSGRLKRLCRAPRFAYADCAIGQFQSRNSRSLLPMVKYPVSEAARFWKK